MDPIKQDAIEKWICSLCQRTPDFYFKDLGREQEVFYCKHSKVFLTIDYRNSPGAVLLPNVSEETYLEVLAETKKTWARLQSNFN